MFGPGVVVFVAKDNDSTFGMDGVAIVILFGD